MEAPVIFGSGLRIRVAAKLRIPGTGYAVYFPVEVSSIQVGCCQPRQPAMCHNACFALKMVPACTSRLLHCGTLLMEPSPHTV